MAQTALRLELMIAATALISLPVLAQTTTTNTSSSPAATHDGDNPASGQSGHGNQFAGHSTSSTPKYFTADHQVRSSKIVGASVYNDQNQSIGSIDDVLMSDTDHKADTAVISVGGFLGMGVQAGFRPVRPAQDR